MPIQKGEAWGTSGPLPADGVVVRSDAEARAVVEVARRANQPVPPLGLLGGDLCRTLGGAGDERRLRSPEAVQLPVDLGAVLIDGRLHWFIAHLVARSGWWRGRIVAAMNAEYLGDWDVAPRGHPGDGRLDVFDVDPAMGMGERWKARRRVVSGAHVPHPRIHQERVSAIQVELGSPTPIWLDGETIGQGRNLSIRIEPAALLCVV